MWRHILKLSLIVLMAITFVRCGVAADPEVPIRLEQGEVLPVEDAFGVFYVYVPTSMLSNPDILVLIHGTPVETMTAAETAEYYMTHWREFAEEEGVVLIAPSFNQEDFSSRKGEIEDMMTGYRGLFGREIGADEWVIRIVDAYQQELGSTGDKFWLYGHSAGGQYVGRFLVTHPERVEKAVISAAVTYPQPNPDIAWPYGMGELHTEIAWDADTVRQEDVIPDRQKWLQATQIPLAVLVGLEDVTTQLQRPGQKGANRVVIARNWVEDMKAFAAENGLQCAYEYHFIPGKGHSMVGLVEFSQEAMRSQ